MYMTDFMLAEKSGLYIYAAPRILTNMSKRKVRSTILRTDVKRLQPVAF